jgi:hypothetical protein
MNRLLTAFLYFGVFAPLSTLIRLIWKDPLAIRDSTHNKSTWIMRTAPKKNSANLMSQIPAWTRAKLDLYLYKKAVKRDSAHAKEEDPDIYPLW